MGSQKAVAAGLVTMMTALLAMFGVADMPTPDTVTEAIKVIGAALVAAGSAHAVVWITRNKTKT